MRAYLQFLALSSLFSLFVAAPVLAAGKMKPGLWEMTMQSDAMKSLPPIPPEQLEKMKQMGIKIPMMQNGGMTHQVCITKEMAERDHPSMGPKEEAACQPKNMQHNGGSWSMDLVCDSPDMKGTGTVKGMYNSDGAMQSTYDFKGVSHGKPVSQHMETKGKWLSADCGDIKPVGDMAKKKQ
ncbi:DUF3617 domain-containing protein [Undibacterium sp. Jales W-56]|uniref:DUF3617 domain-containing protein n=1 Tax=Undibacterium sp. Jales W-56 TaxID=2897325 RepID=UPI0021D020AB|nr:DUF3617 domain-containing protein [Undibacterium sp. Jales W-56]MCU6433085.1 DUF3617 domain-containing protein [Undibacterium sp. Jales W-56]